DAQVLLRKIEILFAELLRFHAGVNIPLEGQHRRARIVRGKGQVPVLKTLVVEQPQLVADSHKAGHLFRRQLAQLVNQLLRVSQQARLGVQRGGKGRFKVERLGRRDNQQHK